MDTNATIAALADPTRRSVLEALREGSCCVGELAEGLPVTRPAVSQHLRVLKDAGLVRAERRGTRHYYHIDLAGLEPLRAYVEGYWTEVLEAFAERARASEGETDEPEY